MLFILLCLGLGWGLFAWKRPMDALAWIPVILPAYLLRASIGPLPTTGLELALIGLVIGATVAKGVTIWKQGWKRSEPWQIPRIAWTAATLLAVCVAPNHLSALGLWRAYVLEPIIVFILAQGLMDAAGLKTLLRSFVYVAVGIAAWSLFQFVTGLGIPHPWDTALATRRATGPFPFPNADALFAAPIAALCAGSLIFRNEILPRRWAWIGLIAGALSTLLAKSAGGSIAILASVMFALVFNAKTRKIGVCILLMAGIAYAVVPIRFSAPLTKLITFQDWSGYVRLRMWKDTVSMLRDRPLLGAGLGAYPTVFKPYQTTTGIEIFQYPHNILLNFWSETGLFGVVAFLTIIITWVRLGRKHPWTLLPLIAILVHGLVDVPYFKNDLAMAFWLFALFASTDKTAHGASRSV